MIWNYSSYVHAPGKSPLAEQVNGLLSVDVTQTSEGVGPHRSDAVPSIQNKPVPQVNVVSISCVPKQGLREVQESQIYVFTPSHSFFTKALVLRAVLVPLSSWQNDSLRIRVIKMKVSRMWNCILRPLKYVWILFSSCLLNKPYR